MPEPFEMNELLQGRKITRVENGTTPGWMVIFFEMPSMEDGTEIEEYLTIFVGGRKGTSDDNYYSTCALHRKVLSGPDKGLGGCVNVRDERDPEMPMSSAHDGASLQKLRDAQQVPTADAK